MNEFNNQIISDLTQLIATELKIDSEDIEADDEIIEYGMDSISFSSIVNKTNKLYNIEIQPTLMFEFLTLEKFAEYLSSHHANKITTHYQQQ